MPQKKPFVTLAQATEPLPLIFPRPSTCTMKAGIRANARKVNAAFSWNKGFKEYFAVKATPNPYILKILQEEGCGVDCSSYTELLMGEACGFTGQRYHVFLQRHAGAGHAAKPTSWALTSTWTI